jgi:hypothetical protein
MNDLKLAQKLEVMIQYGYVALRRFPKSERHVLSQEIRLSMWAMLRAGSAWSWSMLTWRAG